MVDRGQLFEDLVFAEVRLYDLVTDRLREALGEPATTFLVLSVVGRIEDCRVQDLSRHLGLSVGGASKAVDRMERDGFCSRATHPRDRRSSTVELTSSGEELLRRARPIVDDVVGTALGSAPPGRTGEVLAALRRDLTV